MENELRIIAGLSLEQLGERARALQLETDYWQHVLDDSAKVNDAVLEGTNAVIEATTAAVTLLVLQPREHVALVESILKEQRRAIDALLAISNALGDTVDIAAGRMQALRPVVEELQRAAGV